jgi:lipopolysaccharide assembly outer membrane protein LptD (OstA)
MEIGVLEAVVSKCAAVYIVRWWRTMKLLVVGLLLIGTVIVAQQRRPGINEMQRQTVLLDKPLPPPGSTQMFGGVDVRYTADRVDRQGPTVRLDGRVRISTAGFTLTADQAEYRPESGQIDAHGDVHVQIAAPRRPQMGVQPPTSIR